ncbi:MAG: hypothetical protein RLP44_32900 [Aggregatilineales bacterium]
MAQLPENSYLNQVFYLSRDPIPELFDIFCTTFTLHENPANTFITSASDHKGIKYTLMPI